MHAGIRGDEQRERVVRCVFEGHVGDGHAVDVLRLFGETSLIDRVGLEHGQRVEECSEVGCSLDLVETHVMVLEQICLLTLQAQQHRFDRLVTVVANPHGQGVDEEPDHRLDTGETGRATGDGCAEHDVFAADRASQQQTPRCLHHRVEGDAEACTHRLQ